MAPEVQSSCSDCCLYRREICRLRTMFDDWLVGLESKVPHTFGNISALSRRAAVEKQYLPGNDLDESGKEFAPSETFVKELDADNSDDPPKSGSPQSFPSVSSSVAHTSSLATQKSKRGGKRNRGRKRFFETFVVSNANDIDNDECLPKRQNSTPEIEVTRNIDHSSDVNKLLMQNSAVYNDNDSGLRAKSKLIESSGCLDNKNCGSSPIEGLDTPCSCASPAIVVASTSTSVAAEHLEDALTDEDLPPPDRLIPLIPPEDPDVNSEDVLGSALAKMNQKLKCTKGLKSFNIASITLPKSLDKVLRSKSPSATPIVEEVSKFEPYESTLFSGSTEVKTAADNVSIEPCLFGSIGNRLDSTFVVDPVTSGIAINESVVNVNNVIDEGLKRADETMSDEDEMRLVRGSGFNENAVTVTKSNKREEYKEVVSVDGSIRYTSPEGGWKTFRPGSIMLYQDISKNKYRVEIMCPAHEGQEAFWKCCPMDSKLLYMVSEKYDPMLAYIIVLRANLSNPNKFHRINFNNTSFTEKESMIGLHQILREIWTAGQPPPGEKTSEKGDADLKAGGSSQTGSIEENSSFKSEGERLVKYLVNDDSIKEYGLKELDIILKRLDLDVDKLSCTD